VIFRKGDFILEILGLLLATLFKRLLPFFEIAVFVLAFLSY